jgi:outer membrane receptor for ferrienterochelin and colicin
MRSALFARVTRIVWAGFFGAALVPGAARAQQPPPDLSTWSLEELLDQTVTAASKFPQDVREAPASITVITAEDIRRAGHRTLGDTLRSIRGLYTTYDRNYSYVGMRGFARPGDYNTRILLLLDGQRLNDGTYDMAPIGTDFPLDISLVDRIEVIRGPGSSLYGTSAFFAVINVVTRTSMGLSGLQLNTQAGSFGTRGGTATFSRVFAASQELLLSGSVYRSAGQKSLAYPEFAELAPNGVVRNLDHDRATTLFGSLSAGRFKFRGGAGIRDKQIPTAPFGTVFADGRTETDDQRHFLTAVYEGQIGSGWSAVARGGYNAYTYDGRYAYDYGPDGIEVSEDGSTTRMLTGELTARRRLHSAHMVTIGLEMRRLLSSRQWSRDIYGTNVDVSISGTNAGVYVQDEVRLKSWLIGNVGARVDRFPTFGARVSPRVGIVWLPRKQTAVKVLHGRAFRAPNAYELAYYAAQTDYPLTPERMRSSELVWEEALGARVRATVSLFRYTADDIVEQRAVDASTEDLYFVNAGHLSGAGVEAELEGRLPLGATVRVSHAYSRTRGNDGVRLSNSPEHVSKLAWQMPVSGLIVAMEGQAIGQRLTLGGERLDPFFLTNLSATSQADRAVGVSVSVYNLLNQRYADPGAEEHVQQSIMQDGRSVVGRIRLQF